MSESGTAVQPNGVRGLVRLEAAIGALLSRHGHAGGSGEVVAYLTDLRLFTAPERAALLVFNGLHKRWCSCPATRIAVGFGLTRFCEVAQALGIAITEELIRDVGAMEDAAHLVDLPAQLGDAK